MSKDSKAWLQKLHSDPLFKTFIADELIKIRPRLPNWDSASDNTDQWKEKSAQQRGFDLALTVLALELDRN